MFLFFSFSIEKEILNKMDSFSYTQLCQNCKKGCKTFKVYLSDYNVAGRFNLSQVEVIEQFSFVFSFKDYLMKRTMFFMVEDV